MSAPLKLAVSGAGIASAAVPHLAARITSVLAVAGESDLQGWIAADFSDEDSAHAIFITVK